MSMKKWMEQFNWSENPFSLEIYPSLFVGFTNETEAFEKAVDQLNKFILIIGSTGAGKTTFLKAMTSKYESVYLPKPPHNEQELLSFFKNNVLKTNFLDKLAHFLSSEEITLYNLAQKINEALKGKKMLLLVDEAHETNLQVLEWMRTITDQSKGLILVLTGLPKLADFLKNLETLSQRISLTILLHPLSKDESTSLIKKRIEHAGGTSLEPFATNVFSEIYKFSGGIPREIIKICNTLIDEAYRRNASIIDSSYFGEKVYAEHPQPVDFISELTPKQEKIIRVIFENKSLTPSQLIKKLDDNDYQSKTHALRAVNNILTRMIKEEMLIRQKKGKTYIYFLAPKFKAMFVES